MTSATDVGSALRAEGYGDPLAHVGVAGFEVIADLPDGGSAVAVEYVPDSTGSRLYTAIRDRAGTVTQWLYNGRLDRSSPLPVAIPLPGDQGWLVAARAATIRYRTAVDEPWTDAGKDAALLPPAATTVEVTHPNQAPRTVTLQE